MIIYHGVDSFKGAGSVRPDVSHKRWRSKPSCSAAEAALAGTEATLADSALTGTGAARPALALKIPQSLAEPASLALRHRCRPASLARRLLEPAQPANKGC